MVQLGSEKDIVETNFAQGHYFIMWYEVRSSNHLENQEQLALLPKSLWWFPMWAREKQRPQLASEAFSNDKHLETTVDGNQKSGKLTRWGR